MNELVRQMYYQCQDEGLSTEECYHNFAKMIVRQCGFELVDESMQYNSPLIQAFTVKVANRIKTRFGVE